MMLQLNPPIPCEDEDGRQGYAHVLIDYGTEHHLLWLVAWDDTRDFWCVQNRNLRVQQNLSLGRE